MGSHRDILKCFCFGLPILLFVSSGHPASYELGAAELTTAGVFSSDAQCSYHFLAHGFGNGVFAVLLNGVVRRY